MHHTFLKGIGISGMPTPIVDIEPFTVVPATTDEDPDYWLLRDGTDPFPIHLSELHTLMDVIEDFHDEAHPH